jgi:hypothetical protein
VRSLSLACIVVVCAGCAVGGDPDPDWAHATARGAPDSGISTEDSHAAADTFVAEDTSVAEDTRVGEDTSPPPPIDTGVFIDTGSVDSGVVDTGSVAPPDSGSSSDVCSPLSHDNGLGGAYMDCTALGVPGDGATYDESMAREAASSWSSGAGIATITCGSSSCLSASTTATCARWCFSGSLAGRVWKASSTKCSCPYATDPTWD